MTQCMPKNTKQIDNKINACSDWLSVEFLCILKAAAHETNIAGKKSKHIWHAQKKGSENYPRMCYTLTFSCACAC